VISHPLIPTPVRFEGDRGEFTFRSGTAIAYTTDGVAAIVERFCADIARRAGLSARPMAGPPGSNQPSIRIELASDKELDALPGPTGVSPTGDTPPDERHSLAIDRDQIVVRAVEPVGVARGLTTLIQLLATTPATSAGEVSLPAARIFDAPRYAWRGLSLDVARSFFTPDEVRRVIDLLALYKLNVLHLHLTDDQGWRLPVGRSAESGAQDGPFYSAEDLRALVAYAADRFVALVPEVDTPGHASALVRMHPELNTGRNIVELQFAPGRTHRSAWLDPERAATFEVLEEVLTGVAATFPGPYIHIGCDESWGMPDELYAPYVQRLRELVRSVGKRPLGWQESARAGLGPDDVIQYWIDDIPLSPGLPGTFREVVEANFAMSPRDIEAAVAAPAPVIVSPVSHCYLDVPYAEPPGDPAQAERQGRLGLRSYPPRTIAQAFGWEPAEALGPGRAAHVAGVEAAIWGETISDFEDLSFLLLPRLPGVAHKAWSDPRVATWTDHRDRLSRHGRLWAQDDLTYFRASTVDWLS
jgi:hexosaminidase